MCVLPYVCASARAGLTVDYATNPRAFSVHRSERGGWGH